MLLSSLADQLPKKETSLATIYHLSVTSINIHILSALAHEHSQYQHSNSTFREMASPWESSDTYGPQGVFLHLFLQMAEKINDGK